MQPGREEGKTPKKRAGAFIGGVVVSVAGVTLLFVLVAVVGSYTFLPGMVSERVATGVREDFGLGQTPQVEVKSDPPPEMLLGRFSEGDVSFGAGDFWGFGVESVNLSLNPFDVDVRKSLLRRTLVYESPVSGTLEAVVSSDEVGRVAREQSGLDGVSLKDDQLVVEQDPRLFGDLSLPVEVRGDLGLRGGDSLVYTPAKVSIVGVSLPEDTARSILSGTELTFPIEEIADGVTLRRVDISGDRLVLTGDVEGVA